MVELEKTHKKQSKSEKKRNIMYLSISIIVLIIYHLIEYFFGDAMFNSSIKLSKSLQTLNIDFFCFFISHVFYYSLYIYILIAPYLRKKNNEKLFMYVFEIFFSVYFANMLKNVYRILRPSLLSTDLKETGSFCENTYGQPSGHTQAVFSLILIIHHDLTRHMKFLKRFLLFFFTIFFAFLVSFTRVYFGVHSYNQVFMGIIWAVVTFFFFETFSDFFCEQFIIPLINRKKFDKKRKISFIIFTLLMIVLVLIMFLVYFISISKESDEYFSIIVNCKSVFTNLPNFSERSLGTSSVIIFLYFYFLGIFLYPGNFKTFSHFYFDKKKLRLTIRIIFHLLIILGMVLHRVPKINKGKYKIFNIIRSFFIHSILGFFATYGCYISFKYLKIGYNSININNKIFALELSDDKILKDEENISISKEDDKNFEHENVLINKINISNKETLKGTKI